MTADCKTSTGGGSLGTTVAWGRIGVSSFVMGAISAGTIFGMVGSIGGVGVTSGSATGTIAALGITG